MDPLARYDAKFEVRFVLENSRRSGQHDVGEQDIFGVQPRRAVYRGDKRRLDVENIHEDLSALAIDLVVALRGEEVETFGADRLHEGVAATRQDHHAIIGVRPDRVKQIDKLFVSMPIEDQRAPSVWSATSSTPDFERFRRALGKPSR